MTADLSSLLDAALNRAVVFDLPGRTQIEITGADRASFLHNFCTNQIKGLAVGQGCEAFITTIKGRILGHVLVYAGPESLRIETVPDQAEVLLPHLDRYIITEDVQLVDRTSEWSQLYMSGAEAESVLRTALGITDLPAGSTIARFDLDDGDLRKFAFGSAPGWSIVGPHTWVALLKSRMLASGALSGTHELFEQLRIEAGFPLYGVDLSEENLAQEANRTRQAISFTKGCYLGQEPIARIDALGHVNKALCGVITALPAQLEVGAEVYSTPDGSSAAGQLTSAAVWPASGQAVGLGTLRRDLARDGAACWIGPERVPGTVRVR